MDSGSEGLGAVIIQKGHPIAYGSRTLTASQHNYHIEKEALRLCMDATSFIISFMVDMFCIVAQSKHLDALSLIWEDTPGKQILP